MALKKVLIINPYFPPSNAADIHRIRISLPYFNDFGWDATVVCVDEKHSEIVKDPLLLQSIPEGTKVHRIKALPIKVAAKAGLGSLGLRSFWYYRNAVSKLLKNETFDLIYFSTTQFPLCVLGAYWQKRFKIPYVIDMQDLWHSDYYQDKPASQRPAKYWFSYPLHKYLEPIAMKKVNGLVSVSEHYISDLRGRYQFLANIPAATITFGAFKPDLAIALKNQDTFTPLIKQGFHNIVYVGRGGADMYQAIAPVFKVLKKGLQNEPEVFEKLKFYFIGTSYAPNGTGQATILPLALKYGVDKQVIEITDRISYYHGLLTLMQADALFIPGSDDVRYTASKIFPYLLTKKPLLAIFNPLSSTVNILKNCTLNSVVLTFDQPEQDVFDNIYHILSNWGKGKFEPISLSASFEAFGAQQLTFKQTELFDKAINNFNSNGKPAAV